MYTPQRSMRRTGVRRLLYPSLLPLLALLALSCSVALWTVIAAPPPPSGGNLDPTFDGDGIVTTSVNDFDLGKDLAIQSDGKIVVIGETQSDLIDFLVTRYNPDGSLDATFGTGGKVITSFERHSFARAVAIQPDGKIVVVGEGTVPSGATAEIRMVRYNADGSLDSSFGSGGITSLFTLDFASAEDVVLQSDGKIVITGNSIDVNAFSPFLLLARFNSDGSLDDSFDSDGIFLVPQAVGSMPEFGNAVALQSDGKIVAVGQGEAGGSSIDFVVVRCNTDGSLDSSFGTGGIVFTNINDQTDAANDLAIQADGKIVVAGTTNNQALNAVPVIARYNTDGSLDTSFDSDGIVTRTITETDSEVLNGVALQTDGKIVAAGQIDFGTGPALEVKRYNDDGSPDATFGNSGSVITPVADISTGAAVALQSDGKIVAAGSGNGRFDPDTQSFLINFLVVRYGNAPVVNNPPVVTITGPAGGSIYAVGTPVSFTGTFTDDTGDTHTAEWHFESITQPATVGEPSGSTPGTANTTYTFNEPGVYNVSLTVTDNGNLPGTATTVNNLPAFVVIYDPNGGWVTGGGWINSPAGAFAPMPTLKGKATFGFVSKYQNGASVPTGNTEFQFKTGGLNFKSTSYEWLVVSGGKKAQYKGTGTINGGGSYRFMLTCIDGDKPGGDGVDKFRIRIWSDNSGLIYDNQLNAPDSDDPTTALGGGSIVIHH
ncbi:MAG TPA: post-COAP-1 domain-containing protein [Pyrinomonadaceae bacterium]